MDALIIGGHFSIDRSDTIRHTDDFRLTCDGVTMTISNLREYFKNGRRFTDAPRRRIIEQYRPYRQLSYSALHLYSLLTREGFEVGLINCHYTDDQKRLALYKEKPRIVIISTTYMNLKAVRKVIADVREHLPDSFIVAGGNYVRHSYLVWQKRNEPCYNVKEVLNEYFFTTSDPVKGIDAFIYDAHGEETLINLINLVKKGQNIEDLPNIIYYRDNKWIYNRAKPEKFSINKYQILWKKIPRELLSTVVPLLMTYGCPFKCRFCNFSQVKCSRKSLEIVFQEIRDIAAIGLVQKIWFIGDNFLLTPSQIEKFCQRFISEGFPLKWISYMRASSITPQSAELFKKSNADLLLLGLESGSQKILQEMNKKDTVENYYQAMSLLLASDIDTEINFIFGYPGETDETVNETIDFINSLPYSRNQIPYLYLFKFNLAPLSPIFEQKLRSPWELKGNFLSWQHKTMTSEYVDTVLKRVAIQTSQPVFNYLDGVVHLDKKELVNLMRIRDTLSRALLSHKLHYDIEKLWDDLELQISSLFQNKR